MRLTELLLSFRGRIGRQYWWLASLAVAVGAGILDSLIETAAKVTGNGAIDPDSSEFEPTGPFLIAMLAVAIANAWINYALCAKRLHDRNRTAWWLVAQAVALTATVGLVFLALEMPEDARQLWFVAAGVSGALAAGLSIWLFVELGFLKGTAGPNRFGSDPIGPVQTDARFTAAGDAS